LLDSPRGAGVALVLANFGSDHPARSRRSRPSGRTDVEAAIARAIKAVRLDGRRALVGARLAEA
jgi:hypothetical protein